MSKINSLAIDEHTEIFMGSDHAGLILEVEKEQSLDAEDAEEDESIYIPMIHKVFNGRGLTGQDRCDAWRELVPAANSGYATRQSARFFKHKKTLEFMERICFSSNIMIFDPPLPYYACTRNFNFSILINLYLFFIISGLEYKVSPKKVC